MVTRPVEMGSAAPDPQAGADIVRPLVRAQVRGLADPITASTSGSVAWK
jgi:hypothetical protein